MHMGLSFTMYTIEETMNGKWNLPLDVRKVKLLVAQDTYIESYILVFEYQFLVLWRGCLLE